MLRTKTPIDALDSLPSVLVRLGHLGESANMLEKFRGNVVRVAKHMCRYRLVDEYSDDAIANMTRNRRVLLLTLPCGDLDEADIERIVVADTGNWDDKDELVHECLNAHRCPLGCNDSEPRSKARVVDEVALSIGSLFSTPLGYRWKHVEAATCKTYRGRRQHDIPLQALKLQYPVKDVEAAMASLERVAKQAADREAAGLPAQDNNESVVGALKTKVRGGSVVTFLDKDKGCVLLEKAMAMLTSLQGYLNKLFKAEEVVSTYISHLACVGRNSDGMTAVGKDLRGKAIARNLDILSGGSAKMLTNVILSF